MHETVAATPSSARYEVLHRLAAGGMAEVFLAHERLAGGAQRTVVLKRMLPGLSGDADFVEMFLTEGRLASMLSHPNIVRVFAVGDGHDVVVADEPGPFMAMEYLRGADLRTLLKIAKERGERLGVAAAVSATAQIARGLAYAHARCDADGAPLKIVHRDVSPHNVFVTHEGVAKLLDFGVAKSAAQRQVTRSGAMKGKLGYMAPEQVRGARIDARADLFALGVVLWESLTTHRLFLRDNDAAMLYAIAHEPRRPPSELAPEVPSSLDRIVLSLLEREPDARIATADETARALESVLKNLGFDAPEAPLVERMRVLAPADEPTEARTAASLTAITRTAPRERTRTVSIAGTGLWSGELDANFDPLGDPLDAVDTSSMRAPPPDPVLAADDSTGSFEAGTTVEAFSSPPASGVRAIVPPPGAMPRQPARAAPALAQSARPRRARTGSMVVSAVLLVTIATGAALAWRATHVPSAPRAASEPLIEHSNTPLVAPPSSPPAAALPVAADPPPQVATAAPRVEPPPHRAPPPSARTSVHAARDTHVSHTTTARETAPTPLQHDVLRDYP